MLEIELTPSERETVEAYNKNARLWVESLNATNSYWKEEIEILRTYVPRGKLIEIGSGSGKEAKILGKLYEYVGIDISFGLLREAIQLIPEARLLQADLNALPFRANVFDGFWSAATLLHVPRARIHIALKSIHHAIRPGGFGFISIKKGEGERFLDEELAGQPLRRFFAFYNQNEFDEILTQNGYLIVRSNPLLDKQASWLTYFVRVSK